MKKRIYLISVIFFAIDLVSKLVVTNYLHLNQSIKIIKNFFYITYVENNGAAFSILENGRILLLIVTVIALFFINQYLNKEKLKKIEEICFSVIIGGILGNLFDRIIYGHVIDFLDFKIFGYNYPVFNLADTFIVLGIISLILYSFRKEYYEKRNSSRK